MELTPAHARLILISLLTLDGWGRDDLEGLAMSFARRVDSNHKLITEALRKAGWIVIDTSRLRQFVDLVAAKHGRVVLIEVKAGTGKLTASQCALAEAGVPIRIVRTVEEALAI